MPDSVVDDDFIAVEGIGAIEVGGQHVWASDDDLANMAIPALKGAPLVDGVVCAKRYIGGDDGDLEVGMYIACRQALLVILCLNDELCSCDGADGLYFGGAVDHGDYCLRKDLYECLGHGGEDRASASVDFSKMRNVDVVFAKVSAEGCHIGRCCDETADAMASE